MKEFSFKISKGDIVLQAKDETYLSARTALAIGTDNTAALSEMQADERNTHERKLLKSISDSFSGLKAELNEYIVSGDISGGTDEVQVTVSVHDAFREERKETVRTLFENYIAKRVIADWWTANYPAYAAQYNELAALALEELKRAFYYKGEAVLKLFNG